jgi:hypothetical protein
VVMSEFGAMAALKVFKAAVDQGASSNDAVAAAFARLRTIDPQATEIELREWLSHRLAAERLERRRSKGQLRTFA